MKTISRKRQLKRWRQMQRRPDFEDRLNKAVFIRWAKTMV